MGRNITLLVDEFLACIDLCSSARRRRDIQAVLLDEDGSLCELLLAEMDTWISHSGEKEVPVRIAAERTFQLVSNACPVIDEQDASVGQRCSRSRKSQVGGGRSEKASVLT